MKQNIEFIHDRKNFSYIVYENGFQYIMPHAYVLFLKRFLRKLPASYQNPVDGWYNSLRGIEKRIVEKQPSYLTEKVSV